MNYFNKIPTIIYDNHLARNIMARAKLSDNTKSNSRLFFEYTMTESDRVDHLSNLYYGNPAYTWLIWFSNNTIDPYYDMPLSELDFHDFIVSKYGSIELSMRKIIHYKNNWNDDNTVLSISAYNSISDATKKYWSPILDYNLSVKSYRRKTEDQTLSTNRIGMLTINNVSGVFVDGEEINHDLNNYGFSVGYDAGIMYVNNISGAFSSGHIITGRESGATALVVEADNIVSTTSAYTESYYWSAVSYYDYEYQLNESKKNIRLMDAQQTNVAEQELKRVMDIS